MSWLLLAFVPPVLYASTNVIDSMLLQNIRSRPIVFLRLANTIGALAAILFVFPLYPLIPDFSTTLLLLGIGFIYGCTAFLYFSAIDREEVSRIMPIIFLFVPVLFVLEKLFLKTNFTALQTAGIFLTVMGAALISYKHQLRKTIHAAALGLALLYAFIEGFRLLLEKHALGVVHPYQLLVFENIGAAMFPLLTLFFEKKITTDTIIPGRVKKTIFIFILAESLILLAALAFLSASVVLPITIVSAIATSQTFFVLLFSTLVAYKRPGMIKELFDPKNILFKFISVIMIMGGITLIILQSP